MRAGRGSTPCGRREKSARPNPVGHYDASYGQFTTSLYQEIRRETYGEDIGQNGWLNAEEQDRFIALMGLVPEARVLEVACGSGGPALRLVRLTGYHIHGIDIHEHGIANARRLAEEQGLEDRTRFEVMDAGKVLALPGACMDAIVCIDAINHLPDRAGVLADWARLLKPGGRLLFTDPIVVTGPLSNEEISVRGSIAYFLFVPPWEDERLIARAGLELLLTEDVTENVARVAARWRAARAGRERELREVEGDTTYDGQQEFFRVAELISLERRLSRFAHVAAKPKSSAD